MKHTQKGWTALGSLAVVVCTAIGALSAHALLLMFDAAFVPAVPWALITLFLLPIGVTMSVYTELGKVCEVKALSDSERRRISTTVKMKQRQTLLAALFFMIGGIMAGFGLFAASGNPALLHPVIVAIGGIMGISAAAVPLLVLQLREAQNFRTAVVVRSNRKKQIAATLARLTTK